MIQKSHYILILTILLVSCIEEIPVDVSRTEPQLVVEASINNRLESHTVRLSSITNFDGVTTSTTLGHGATVEISEVGGPSITLFESTPGIYRSFPGDLIGWFGRTYQLRITLSNGDQYVSTEETIPESVNIVSGEANFVERTFENANGVPQTYIGHDIEVEIENSEVDHFYRFENRAWANVVVGYGDCDPPPTVPSTCWAFRNKISDNELIIGNNVGLGSSNYKFTPVSVPFDFKTEYIAIIRLNAMSAESYLFWEAVNDQLERPGGLFDRPFAPITGNITQVNGDKKAMGYFHAYATEEEIVCFDRSDVLATSVIPIIACSDTCPNFWAPATFQDVSEFFCEE